ncbi:MAG: hypothetical protein AB8B62_19015 [Roseobacter sp.]
MRRKLRAAIRSVEAGKSAPQPALIYETSPIPTFGGDTMLRISEQPGRDDGGVLKEVAHQVADIHIAADALKGAARGAKIIEDLKAFEASWTRSVFPLILAGLNGLGKNQVFS